LKLVPVNGSDRLWAISDIWPRELVDQVMAIDWLTEPYMPNQPGEMRNRRKLSPKYQCIQRLDEHITQSIPLINQITNCNFVSSAWGKSVETQSTWWLCEPGYLSYIHHDGELPNNMLIFWHAPDTSYGTTFYNSDSEDDVFYQFESVPGTGYLMLNHADHTGHRPVQYHGMLKEIPANHWRLACFYQFSTK